MKRGFFKCTVLGFMIVAMSARAENAPQLMGSVQRSDEIVKCLSLFENDSYSELFPGSVRISIAERVAVTRPQPVPGRGISGVRLMDRGGTTYAAVDYEFDTWSDLTAIFRPSRWQKPFGFGGPLSFVNPEAWSVFPERTTTTLIGTVVTVGGLAVIISAVSGGGGGGDGSSGMLEQDLGSGGTMATGDWLPDTGYSDSGGMIETEI
ncbi:MAG: hypothetical protein E4H02_11725 [Lentisphaerales bacterium]|nr:MAG: hypothetical protein E4H02_11725 [Lentisphaerales bacterium]